MEDLLLFESRGSIGADFVYCRASHNFMDPESLTKQK